MEGLTTRLERATSRTDVKEFCEPPDKENDVPSASGTSDSADPERQHGARFQRMTVTASAWQVGVPSLCLSVLVAASFPVDWFRGYCEYDLPHLRFDNTIVSQMTLECT